MDEDVEPALKLLWLDMNPATTLPLTWPHLVDAAQGEAAAWYRAGEQALGLPTSRPAWMARVQVSTWTLLLGDLERAAARDFWVRWGAAHGRDLTALRDQPQRLRSALVPPPPTAVAAPPAQLWVRWLVVNEATNDHVKVRTLSGAKSKVRAAARSGVVLCIYERSAEGYYPWRPEAPTSRSP